MTKYEMKIFINEKFEKLIEGIKVALNGLNYKDSKAISDIKFPLLLEIIGELIQKNIAYMFSEVNFDGEDEELFVVTLLNKLGKIMPFDFPWIYIIIFDNKKIKRFIWLYAKDVDESINKNKTGIGFGRDDQLEIHFYPEEQL